MNFIKTVQGQSVIIRKCVVQTGETSPCVQMASQTKECKVCEADNCNGEGF